MKNFLAVLMAVSLLLTMCCAPVLAEEENQYFGSTVLLDGMGLSTEEWMSMGSARAALAAMIVPELLLACGEDSPIYATVLEGINLGTVFVGVDSDAALNVLYFGEEHFAYVLYVPPENAMGAALMDFDSSLDADGLMQLYVAGGLLDEYFAVPQEDIAAFLDNLQTMLGGE
ncbi:MAG: hypothetical protein ACI4O7_06450 [Aristaeellaceae bacterium]